jgi:hypothetical protein
MPNGPPWAGSVEQGLCRQWDGSGVAQRGGQSGEDGQVYVQPDAGQATDPQRVETPFVLESPELAFDGAPGAVDGLPPVGGARDKGVQPIRLDLHAGGLALPGAAAPL